MEGAKRDCSLARCCEEGRPSHHARRRMAHACPGQDPEMGVWGGGLAGLLGQAGQDPEDPAPRHHQGTHTHPPRPAPPVPSTPAPPSPPRCFTPPPPPPSAARRRRRGWVHARCQGPPGCGGARCCSFSGGRPPAARAAHTPACFAEQRLPASPSNACLLRRATRACFTEQRVPASPSNACLLHRATPACCTEPAGRDPRTPRLLAPLQPLPRS